MGYLLGSIPVALLVARRYGVDLRATGDGNPGAWNALEQLGAAARLAGLRRRRRQGLAAGLAGLALGGWSGRLRRRRAPRWSGHAFPLFARFRGGKAVMTFVGGGFALSPLAALLCAAPCCAARHRRDRCSRTARAPASSPSRSCSSLFEPVEHVAGTGALMCLIGALFLAVGPPPPLRAGAQHREREARRGRRVGQRREPERRAAAGVGAAQRGEQRDAQREQREVQPARPPQPQDRERHRQPHDREVGEPATRAARRPAATATVPIRATPRRPNRASSPRAARRRRGRPRASRARPARAPGRRRRSCAPRRPRSRPRPAAAPAPPPCTGRWRRSAAARGRPTARSGRRARPASTGAASARRRSRTRSAART